MEDNKTSTTVDNATELSDIMLSEESEKAESVEQNKKTQENKPLIDKNSECTSFTSREETLENLPENAPATVFELDSPRSIAKLSITTDEELVTDDKKLQPQTGSGLDSPPSIAKLSITTDEELVTDDKKLQPQTGSGLDSPPSIAKLSITTDEELVTDDKKLQPQTGSGLDSPPSIVKLSITTDEELVTDDKKLQPQTGSGLDSPPSIVKLSITTDEELVTDDKKLQPQTGSGLDSPPSIAKLSITTDEELVTDDKKLQPQTGSGLDSPPSIAKLSITTDEELVTDDKKLQPQTASEIPDDNSASPTDKLNQRSDQLSAFEEAVSFRYQKFDGKFGSASTAHNIPTNWRSDKNDENRYSEYLKFDGKYGSASAAHNTQHDWRTQKRNGGDNRMSDYLKFDVNYGSASTAQNWRSEQRSGSASTDDNRKSDGDKKSIEGTKFIDQNDTNYTDFLAIKFRSTICHGKLYEKIGDLFMAPTNFSLAHCVGADFRMSAGIAVYFRTMFQRVNELQQQNQTTGGLAVLSDKDRFIYYLVTKERSNYKPTYYTLWQSLVKLKEHCVENGVENLAIPQIGCGLDRLEWDSVKQMLEHIFRDVNINIVVYILK